MNIKLINSKVSTILKSLPALSLLPVDIEKIAIARGTTVTSYPLGEDVSGLLAIKDGTATIGYNAIESKVRRRFTIAHELGHYELHRDKSDLFIDKQFIFRRAKKDTLTEHEEMEKEANYFASAILMPTDLLRREVDKDNIDLFDENAIKKLAETFDVSQTAMSFRISSLGFL